jgi:hypothetical protein
MKFLLTIILLSLIFNCTKSETEMETELNNYSEKLHEKAGTTVQAKFRVEAMMEEEMKNEAKSFSYYSKMYFKKLFSFNTPLNKCVAENCQYCCLSLNFCGSKQQCENSYFTMNLFKILFITICIILLSFLCYKIYITDAEPEQQEEDKVNEKTLGLLISLFIHNRENRRKFKP